MFPLAGSYIFTDDVTTRSPAAARRGRSHGHGGRCAAVESASTPGVAAVSARMGLSTTEPGPARHRTAAEADLHRRWIDRPPVITTASATPTTGAAPVR